MRGQLHLLKCRCVLSQLKNTNNPIAHQFVVFSAINDNDEVIQKYSQCNNCGIIHKIIDICKSEILQGKENLASILTIDDIKTSLPANLVSILERHNVDLHIWEQAKFVLENKLWGDFLLLVKEEENGTKQGKYVRIMSESFFKIESFSRTEVLTPEE